MANSAAAFRRSDREDGVHAGSKDAVIMCHLARGAIIYSRPDKTSSPMMILESEQAWEALFSRDDTEWLNGVVLGHGLGWVEAHQVGDRQEKLLLVETERLGLILNDFCSDDRSNRSRSNSVTFCLNAFLSSIGHQL